MPSAISDPDPGTLAALLPAASAAALSCCGAGFVPFLPFPASLRARGRTETSKTSPFCELIFHTSRASRRVAPRRSRRMRACPGPFAVGVSIGSPGPRPSVFAERMMERRINRHSIVRRFHQKASETGRDRSFLLLLLLSVEREANLSGRARNVDERHPVVSSCRVIENLYISCDFT